jgi:RNA polymerase sigma-70 factor (ECF subfamily)
VGPLRESDLIAGLRNGDPDSYASVFRAYHASLCGFVYGYLHNRADADEIVQDLFLALWQKRERLEITTSLRSYLFRAVRNRVLNLSAQARLEERWLREADNEKFDIADPAVAPDEALLAQELETRARRAMDSLPPGCHRVLQLRWVDQLRPQEIADVLGISLKGVENQLARARNVMRQQLGSD